MSTCNSDSASIEFYVQTARDLKNQPLYYKRNFIDKARGLQCILFLQHNKCVLSVLLSTQNAAVAYLNTKCCRKNTTIISKGLKFDGLDLNCCFTVNYDPFAH